MAGPQPITGLGSAASTYAARRRNAKLPGNTNLTKFFLGPQLFPQMGKFWISYFSMLVIMFHCIIIKNASFQIRKVAEKKHQKHQRREQGCQHLEEGRRKRPAHLSLFATQISTSTWRHKPVVKASIWGFGVPPVATNEWANP